VVHQAVVYSLLLLLFVFTAGVDFSQTGSLIKDRHLLQRQQSSTGATGQLAGLAS